VRSKPFLLCAAVAALGLAAVGCASDAPAATKATAAAGGAKAASATQLALRGPSVPTEFVGLTTQIPIDSSTFDTVAGPLFGTKAANGSYTKDLSLGAGLHLSSEAHPASADEVVLTVSMDVTGTATPPRRTVARVPASLSYGSTFIATVDAALAQADKVKADDPNGTEPFRLEYRTTSAKGGKLTIAAVYDPATGTALEFDVQGPTTSLSNGNINEPAQTGKPFESLYGLVWFGVSKDQFDFFANRAYGISKGKSQNFADFELVPHNWLRLTVTPKLDEDRVDVGFEVVTLDGRRIPIAKAPASLVAGEEFMQTVFRMIDTMEAQEQAKPGSSTPWKVPFYYDDPEGGGVVEVIAQGSKGESKIAYSIESPVKELDDVAFVPYQGTVKVPKDWDAPSPTCAQAGSTAAAAGTFDLSFEASSTVRGSKLKAPLKGVVKGSIYKAADVKITGPLPGTKAVVDFTLPDVDVTKGPSKVYPIDTQLPAGDYQILGFMDIDGNAAAGDGGPDEGDPVFIPIGGFTMACAKQPAVAEFAILLPPGQ